MQSSLAGFQRHCLPEPILSLCADLGDQITDGDELRLTTHQASDFLERRLFFLSEGMRLFAGLIEARMGAAKFVASGISRNQTEVFVEFVPDTATRGRDAFHHRKSNDA